MVFNQKYPFIHIFIIMTVGWGEEFLFPLSSDYLATLKSNHWQHPKSNSTMDINGIEIDVFQWQVAAENRESVNVDLVNPVWQYAGEVLNDIVLPKAITISKVLNFRGTPTVYIKVTPWRMVGNAVEILISGKIKIWVDPANFPITFNHPYLLNGEPEDIQRTFVDKMQYLIIYPDKFENAAEILVAIHSMEVPAEYQLNVEKVTVEEITAMFYWLDTNYAIREYLDSLDLNISMDFLLLLGDET